jgi:Domain of unknown function (DUF4375)
MPLPPEFEFLQSVYEPLGKRAAQFGVLTLSEPERVLMLSWWAKGIFDNGGFLYFYQGATNILQVADAFEAIGFTAGAKACRRSTEGFEGGQPPEDLEEMKRWLAANSASPSLLRKWEELCDPIWKIPDSEFDRLLVDFLLKHRGSFEFVPEMRKREK